MACFVTFEGIDGTGKSTQAQMLADSLERLGVPFIMTREPGGTSLGSRLRALLLEQHEHAIGAQTEMLLMAADRAQHVDEVIRPALEQGIVVLCDRYVDSSIAYQGAAGVPVEQIRAVNEVATRGLMPHVTFLFDIDPEHTLRRGRSDRIEARSEEYHRAVRDAFVGIAKEEPGRVVLIKVEGRSRESIHKEVFRAMQRWLP